MESKTTELAKKKFPNRNKSDSFETGQIFSSIDSDAQPHMIEPLSQLKARLSKLKKNLSVETSKVFQALF